jgi:hypothetical protein
MMFKPKWFMIFHDCFIHLSAYSASPSPTLCVNWGTGTWQPCHAECSHKRAWSRDAAHRETSKLGRAGRKMSVEICRNMSQREKYEKARWIFGRWNLWVGETRGVGRCQQDSAVASGQMWPAPRLLLRETHKSCINLMILPYLAISCHILPSHYPLGCWIFFLLVPVISSSSASLLVQRSPGTSTAGRSVPSKCEARSTAKPGSEIRGVPASDTKAMDLKRTWKPATSKAGSA